MHSAAVTTRYGTWDALCSGEWPGEVRLRSRAVVSCGVGGSGGVTGFDGIRTEARDRPHRCVAQGDPPFDPLHAEAQAIRREGGAHVPRFAACADRVLL